ncbi:MAG TPA: hypothetical protein DCZ63_15255 [Geobacter sp.]|nr:hypothetical protein [Geobacter sp.]
MSHILILVAVLLAPVLAQGKTMDDTMQCLNSCLDAVESQAAPPVEKPVQPAKIFPHKITFERESDQGNGNGAVVYFSTLSDSEITAVSVNGEVAIKGNPWQGHPVFKLSKTGDLYTRPLKFSITYNGGFYGVEQSPNIESPAPSGGNSETTKPDGYANGGRGNARFKHPGSWYGKNIEVWIDGVKKLSVPDGSKRQEGKNGLVWKPISENDKKLVVIGEYNTQFGSCTIKW